MDSAKEFSHMKLFELLLISGYSCEFAEIRILDPIRHYENEGDGKIPHALKMLRISALRFRRYPQ